MIKFRHYDLWSTYNSDVSNVSNDDICFITGTGVIRTKGTNFICPTTFGTSGQVLTSNGSGTAPTWQNAGFQVPSGWYWGEHGISEIDSFGFLLLGSDPLDESDFPYYQPDSMFYVPYIDTQCGAFFIGANTTFRDLYSGTYKNVTASSFIVPDGTSSGYLKADGSIDTTTSSNLVTSTERTKLNNLMNLTTVSGASVTQALSPNTFYSFGTVTSLTITLSTPVSNIPNQYAFEFDSGSTAATVSLPASISWQNGEPEVEANKHYEISIRYAGNSNYYGLFAAWE